VWQRLRMLGAARLVAFVPVADAGRARAFYVDVLGLTVVEDTPFALVCDANGTTVRITPVSDLSPQPFTVLGWAVDDIAATGRALVDAGVALLRFDGMEQDELGVWTTPGGRVAWFNDPDGNVLSISQPAAGAHGS
jgi:catechol 2,3-dioxygenase-like lactoylglutathione lyase family enzyme